MDKQTLTEDPAGIDDQQNAEINEAASEASSEVIAESAEAKTAAEVAEEVTETEEPLSLEQQLEAARAEAQQNLDGWMRTQAEFANARKRMEKQRSQTYANATVDVLTKFLPVLDDFGRALREVPPELADHSWLEGIQLVQRKITTILEGFNVKPIEAIGQPFDPNCHEAIMKEASDEYESGIVSKELQQGYQMGDRVIRPSLVYVAE